MANHWWKHNKAEGTKQNLQFVVLFFGLFVHIQLLHRRLDLLCVCFQLSD